MHPYVIPDCSLSLVRRNLGLNPNLALSRANNKHTNEQTNRQTVRLLAETRINLSSAREIRNFQDIRHVPRWRRCPHRNICYVSCRFLQSLTIALFIRKALVKETFT